jgi:glutamate-1-semialdehyde 2,1-aminomutase
MHARSWRFAGEIGKCNVGARMQATPTFDGPTRAGGPAPPLSIGRSRGLLARAGAVDATLAYEGYVLPQDRLVEHEYPLFAQRGEGAYVWDVDGNRYIDFILAYGTIVLGHAHPGVSAAVVQEIESGFALGVPKPVQVELAELVSETIPGAERVLLLKTGSDATSAAVRVSRAHTGRERVVRWGYCGWHDWAALRPSGVPAGVIDQVHTFTYNDPASLERVFERHGDEIACCVMMPFELDLPREGFLERVAEIVRGHGALLVLDEMRTGFRVALGGAQERLGIEADLATFGKAMANGYPISALTGREEVMRMLGEVHISSTFYMNAAEMAAARATILELRRGTTLPRIERLGRRLLDGLAELADGAGIEATPRGLPQMPFLQFSHEERELRERAKRAFYTETVRRGILLHPNHHWYISGAMSERDIDETLEACEAGFAAVRAVSAP